MTTDSADFIEQFCTMKRVSGRAEKTIRGYRTILLLLSRDVDILDRSAVVKRLAVYDNPSTFNAYLSALSAFYSFLEDLREAHKRASPIMSITGPGR